VNSTSEAVVRCRWSVRRSSGIAISARRWFASSASTAAGAGSLGPVVDRTARPPPTAGAPGTGTYDDWRRRRVAPFAVFDRSASDRRVAFPRGPRRRARCAGCTTAIPVRSALIAGPVGAGAWTSGGAARARRTCHPVPFTNGFRRGISGLAVQHVEVPLRLPRHRLERLAVPVCPRAREPGRVVVVPIVRRNW